MKQVSLNNLKIANSAKRECQYGCGQSCTLANINRHEKACSSNPDNIKNCPVCGAPVKEKRNTTCSYSCSNTYFRSGLDNPNFKGNQYRTICFHYHEKECVICGEDKIVEVHHLDEDKNNNSPGNLIPLCPTHHAYWHSRYKDLVEKKILTYAMWFKNQ